MQPGIQLQIWQRPESQVHCGSSAMAGLKPARRSHSEPSGSRRSRNPPGQQRGKRDPIPEFLVAIRSAKRAWCRSSMVPPVQPQLRFHPENP